MSDLIESARRATFAAIARTGEAVLQFSGGASSLACLYLAKPWWGRVLVLWANAGDEYPESRAQMDQIKAMVPFFHELRGHARTTQNVAGWPVDMLPARATQAGRCMRPDDAERPMVLTADCCSTNVFMPMRDFLLQTGLKSVIRGQRSERVSRASEVTDGTVLEGVTYSLPIESWTRRQVEAYLEAEGVELPAQYALGATSLKCMHCTGGLRDDGAGRLAYLREHHPHPAKEVLRRLRIIDAAQDREARHLRALLDAPADGAIDRSSRHSEAGER